ncbi:MULTISPECIES: ADP-ribosylglycohydrolase family protein [Nonomuraea]|uniref:ADP-ribosylglycohydrolase family protein n=1 Tax=Nonomuraea ferruginea TaxID=46174 RepID=A0ABT4SU19_9ACTN|nr:ADP-ribosylglycohydrolase family protein [Nonomuraea ferruginea]MDA0640672.1 ADP-ribosylglycohydrolase family protein [Nonomuraea ferruginea]
MAEVTYRSRVRGCVLGGAIGDALGGAIEFESIAGIRARHGQAGVTGMVTDGIGRAGLITDDTQMTLFTLEGLIRAELRAATRGFADTAEVVRSAYLRWLDTQRHDAPPPPGDPHHRTGWLREQRWLYARRAPGNACLSGLRARPGRDGPLGEPGPVNRDSKGCGTVMRSAPFGLLGGSAREAFELAAACARITHGHPTGYYAAGAFAALVHFVAEDLTLYEAVHETLRLLATYPGHEETSVALRAADELAGKGEPSPERVESLGGGWVAEEALAIAVYCALTREKDFAAALLLAVNHSGDSDSTGSMTGNLLGAVRGEDALPVAWLYLLEGRETITELADDFAGRGRADPAKYPPG